MSAETLRMWIRQAAALLAAVLAVFLDRARMARHMTVPSAQ